MEFCHTPGVGDDMGRVVVAAGRPGNYELRSEEPGHDQIYSAMNHAMRLRDAAGIDFWRPPRACAGLPQPQPRVGIWVTPPGFPGDKSA